ncbi:MAG: leucyl aminopeptidase, partial [Lachnospiraceae bacterium]|nr:leucyl aminopeptidase [Lachnospiraceae bacterium]
MEERFLLVRERILEIGKENTLPKEYSEYFSHVAEFLGKVFDYKDELEKGMLPREKAEVIFKDLYKDTEAGVYEESYLAPAFAANRLGLEQGQFLSALYAALRSTILWVAEKKSEFLTVYCELFVQIYGCYVAECEGEAQYEYALKEAKDVYYYFWHDYAEIFVRDNVRAQVLEGEGIFYDIVMNSDLSDLSYLYRYGKNIGKNEIEMAEYLNKLPEEDICSMAKTFTEGYRIGFENTRKDISIKSAAGIRYPIGMERVVRQAV